MFKAHRHFVHRPEAGHVCGGGRQRGRGVDDGDRPAHDAAVGREAGKGEARAGGERRRVEGGGPDGGRRGGRQVGGFVGDNGEVVLGVEEGGVGGDVGGVAAERRGARPRKR